MQGSVSLSALADTVCQLRRSPSDTEAELRCGSWMVDQPCWLSREPSPATGHMGAGHTWATAKSCIL